MTDTKIDFKEINRIHNLKQKVKSDPLVAFLSEPEFDRLESIKEQNLHNFFSLCNKVKIRYIYLGPEEICGCDGIEYNRWPAVWHIADSLGFSSCGNSDQYQIHDSSKLCFPEDAYGYWDTQENRKLTVEEIASRKFRHVVRR